jgi:multisubunit Na+/H+ antiporter MnhB subunit
MGQGDDIVTAFDILLIITLVWVAISSLSEAKMFKSAVMFVVFGLFMALAWVRLGTPDVALAEAAIGAGVTGVLMLDAVGHLRHRVTPYPTEEERVSAQTPYERLSKLWLVPAAIAGAMFVVIVRAILALPSDSLGLSVPVGEMADVIGISNEVTAVLLDFRGYDTLLEVTVLMLATVAVLSLREDRQAMFRQINARANPVLDALTRGVMPLMILVAGHLVWIGSSAPGGAFQGGAVLGAAGILLILSGYARPQWAGRLVMRAVLAIGLLAFLSISFAAILAGGAFLQYPDASRKELILFIEILLTVSIGASLVSLFLASASSGSDEAPS